MKAIVCEKYGPPEALQYREVPVPEPTGRQVQVRVKAAAVNDYDWSMVRGEPKLYRLFLGLFRPKRPVPGMEVAGVISATGPDASAFKIGDAVHGDTSDHGFGSFAEYMCVHEDALLKKPEKLSFAEAVSVPHALCLAHQGLALAGFRPGMELLINGAGGGAGTFALQLAKAQGARVTGVDTGPKLERMLSSGFDRIIDYRKADFARMDGRYDLIFDTKSTRSPGSVVRALAPGGVYVTVGGTNKRLIQLLLANRLGMKNVRVLALKANKGLAELHSRLGHDLNPVVDGPYPLEEAPRRIRYFGEGRHFGKVVLEP